MADITETLFNSIDVLVDKKIEKVSFDETIKATVVDDSKGESGEYKVTTGQAKFVAYSTETSYRNNDTVMVTVPQGNYDNQKIIVGKWVDKSNTPLVYHSPFSEIIDVTNNLIRGDLGVKYCWANDTSGENGFAWDTEQNSFTDSAAYADNNSSPAKPWGLLWESGEIMQQGFTRLGLQGQFSTWLSEYNTISGNYGLALEITFENTDNNQTFVKWVTFDSSDFFGNVYAFETFYTQEIVYDIEDYLSYPIVQLRLFGYQRCNFKDESGEFIQSYNNSDMFGSIGPNIFFKDLYVCLGVRAETFTSDTAFLSSENGTSYRKGFLGSDGATVAEKETSRATENQRLVTLRWIHKFDEEDVIKTVEQATIPPNYYINWYRYKLGASSPDEFAGAHWVRFYGSYAPGANGNQANYPTDFNLPATGNEDNRISQYFIPNVNNQTEQLKVVIYYQENQYVKRVVAVSNILEFVNDDEIASQVTIREANALAIKYGDEEHGNYFLYNKSGKLGEISAGSLRKLIAVFDPNISLIYGTDGTVKGPLQPGEYTSIKWEFPIENSMIVPMDNGGNEISPNEVPDDVEVYYKIKSYLNRSATNNTVTLTVVKDGIEYTASTRMLFGTAGTSGSPYTLFVTWDRGQTALNVSSGFDHTLSGTVSLLNQDGEVLDIPEDSELEYAWKVAEYTTTGAPNRNVTPAIEKKRMLYPVLTSSSDRISDSILQSGGLTAQNGTNTNPASYYFLDTTDSGQQYYLYHVEHHTFETCSYSDNGQKYRYPRSDNERKYKLSFQQVDVTTYPTDFKYFIEDNGQYVLDYFDSFNEARIYYIPEVSEEVDARSHDIDGAISIGTPADNRFVITADNNLKVNSLFILQITLTNFGDYDLVAYFPIPLKNGETPATGQQTYAVDYIQGPTEVRYLASGEVDYYKNPCSIQVRKWENNNFVPYRHELDNNELNGHWELFCPATTDPNFNNKLNNFIPQLEEKQKHESAYTPYDVPELKPLSVYIPTAPNYGLMFIDDDTHTTIWCQPILVYEDNYPSTTLNQWDGKSITTDEDTGTIVANGMAAGKKERDNTFTGVVLGDWSRTDTESFLVRNTGVYGFNHGSMSYAWKDDGTGFVGKDGRGRIYFDGNRSNIYSSNWLLNHNGLFMDIDDGIIRLQNLNNIENDLSRGMTFASVEGLLNYHENYPNNHIYYQSGNTKIELTNFNNLTSDFVVNTTFYILQANDGETNSNKYITLSSAETTYPLSIGTNSSVGLRKFRVKWNGDAYFEDAYLNNAYLKDAYLENGYFSGHIEARDGTLGDLKVKGTLDCMPDGIISGGTINGSTINGSTIYGGHIYGGEVRISKAFLNGWFVGNAEDLGPDFTGTGNALIGIKTSGLDGKITALHTSYPQRQDESDEDYEARILSHLTQGDILTLFNTGTNIGTVLLPDEGVYAKRFSVWTWENYTGENFIPSSHPRPNYGSVGLIQGTSGNYLVGVKSNMGAVLTGAGNTRVTGNQGVYINTHASDTTNRLEINLQNNTIEIEAKDSNGNNIGRISINTSGDITITGSSLTVTTPTANDQSGIYARFA